jgi:DNA excision repair protein ERCC-3
MSSRSLAPRKYDVPWKDLERQGWIATADVVEVRIPLPHDTRIEYATADERDKYRIAAENKDKYKMLDELLIKHHKDQVLIIGMYLEQLEKVSAALQRTADHRQNGREAAAGAVRQI